MRPWRLDEPCCEVCGATEDLRIAPLMTGDKFGQEPKHPICGACFRAWYESGLTTPEAIRQYRFGPPPVLSI